MAVAQEQTAIPFVADIATTAAYELPSTGTITAKQIGDGVWWRPVLDETSITQVLTDLNAWGVSNLYVDVFRSGHTLFPSGLFPQRYDARDRDWLAYIIAEAHSHDIRVHGWMQVLCWQDPDEDGFTTDSLLAQHPNWLEVTVNGFAVDGKTASRYVSPGVPEVRDALVTLAEEACRYPLNGLNLDSVEYNSIMDSGYNSIVLSDFEAEHGLRPGELRVDQDEDSDWMKWVTFREDKLTSVVQLMAERARQVGEANGRRVLVSVTVQPGYDETRGLNRRYQDWQRWLEDELVDVTIPECFKSELPELEQQLWEARSIHMGTRVACIPGLQLDAPGENMHPPLSEQKRLLRNAGFQFCTVLDYEGLRHAMANPEEEPEDRRGFWGLFGD